MELEIRREVNQPQIENYTDYRTFMKDFYSFKKNQRSSFSYRQFALKTGVKSPNYLQLVMQARRNLSSQMALNVAIAMGLTSVEGQYFIALVRTDNAKTEEEAAQAKRERLIAIKHLSEKKIPLAQREILKSWYHLVVRELVTLKDFSPEGEWIASRLNGYISSDEAERAFNNLVKAGFVKLFNGHWVQSDPVLTTGEAFDEERVVKHHQETLKLWTKHIDDFANEEREFGLLNIPINKSKIPELQEKIRNFQSELIGWLKDENDPDQVVQVGLYLMPISK